MASIRRRNNKWQAQVRRRNYPLITQTFRTKELAEKWARGEDTKIDDGFLVCKNKCKKYSLQQLIHRYIAEVLPKKRVKLNETIILKAFMREELVNKPLTHITPEHFAK